MSNAYFLQLGAATVNAVKAAGTPDVTIASLKVPAGSYVVFAKFEVAVRAASDTDQQSRISLFRLHFAGKTDKAFCDLKQGGLDTVVLNIAGTYSLSGVAAGQGLPPTANIRLYCETTTHDLEIKNLAISAIPVDGIN